MGAKWVLWIAIAACAIACRGKTTGETTAAPDRRAGLPGAPVDKVEIDVVRVDDKKEVARLPSIHKPHVVAWIDVQGIVEAATVDDAWPVLPTNRQRVDEVKRLHDDFVNWSTVEHPDVKKADGDPPTAWLSTLARLAPYVGRPGPSGVDEGVEHAVRVLGVDKLFEVPVFVIAAPGAPAALVASVVAQNGGVLGVSVHAELEVLSLGFGELFTPEDVKEAPSVEVDIAPDGLHLVDPERQTQTLVAWKNGAADRDALRAAYIELRAERFKDREPVVDVLVAPGDTTAQQLVDVLVALDSSGARPVSLGTLSMAPDGRLEALKKVAAYLDSPQTAVGIPAVEGDLDKASIRRVMQENVAKIQFCYEQALRANPKLSGTVEINFRIVGTGRVQTARGVGLDPTVARCVAEAIKKLTFERPKGSGNVQVDFPFTFRPSGR